MTTYRQAFKELASLGEYLLSRRDSQLIPPVSPSSDTPDIGSISGQHRAKFSLLVAAAGGHNLLLLGPPGEGKSFLASTLPGILPPLMPHEWHEMASTWRMAGLDYITHVENPSSLRRIWGLRRAIPERIKQPLLVRPFRAIGPTITPTSLIGGGRSKPTPGEFALAHNGVIYFDEFPQFNRQLIDSLRQPLQDGAITVSRGGRSHTFPCRSQLIASANPCPCGYWIPPDIPCDDSLRSRCQCSPLARYRYLAKLSGPILDRIDLFAFMLPISSQERIRPPTIETPKYRTIVLRSQLIARKRNPGQRDNKHCRFPSLHSFGFSPDAFQYFQTATQPSQGFSTRSAYNLARVSRTIADLQSSPLISCNHISVAIDISDNPLQ